MLYLHIFIYLEPKWPLFWLEKALFQGGWPSKIKVIWFQGIHIYGPCVYYYYYIIVCMCPAFFAIATSNVCCIYLFSMFIHVLLSVCMIVNTVHYLFVYSININTGTYNMHIYTHTCTHTQFWHTGMTVWHNDSKTDFIWVKMIRPSIILCSCPGIHRTTSPIILGFGYVSSTRHNMLYQNSNAPPGCL